MNPPANPALQAAPLDPLDIGVRLDELRLLEDGWHEHSGKAPCEKGLDWLEEAFRLHYTGKATPPRLYPTFEGGISAEWSTKQFEISLEIDLATKQGDWHAVNVETHISDTKDINLTDERGWQWLVSAVREKSPQISAD